VVEVDAATGAVSILDYVSVNDAGPRINPTVVDGQIQGGIAQGLGGAMMEEIYYDEGAQPLGSFLDYAVPRATDMPDVRQDHLETPSPLNPLGVKGLGEGGTLAPPAVLSAAVEDALSPLGVQVTRTPLTASNVWRLIQSAPTPPPHTPTPDPSPLRGRGEPNISSPPLRADTGIPRSGGDVGEADIRTPQGPSFVEEGAGR
jgi:2-furoyl-CoA dehydrogenase large subunit